MTAIDFDGLISAVHAHPDEDTPRLILADYLDESGGDGARAELIRVQCELERDVGPIAAWQAGRYQNRPDLLAAHGELRTTLRYRQTDLLRDNRARWLAGPRCRACSGAGKAPAPRPVQDCENCPTCHGTGDGGGLTWGFSHGPRGGRVGTVYMAPPEVEFVRGFERVLVPRLADCVQEKRDKCDQCLTIAGHRWCEVCSGAGSVTRTVPSDWLAAVVRHHPYVEAVVPLDREPRAGTHAHNSVWFWDVDSRDRQSPATLPECVWTRCNGVHPTRQAAVAALGRALVRWARG